MNIRNMSRTAPCGDRSCLASPGSLEWECGVLYSCIYLRGMIGETREVVGWRRAEGEGARLWGSLVSDLADI